MNYFVIEIEMLSDGQYAQNITRKESLREAKMLYHQVMASALANNNVIHCACFVTDEGGNQIDISLPYEGE